MNKKTKASKKALKKTSKKSPKKASQKSKEAVTKYMTLGNVIHKYPESAEIMLKHGLHCVGCHVAYWETIEQGCKGHGMSDKQIKNLIDEINKSIN